MNRMKIRRINDPNSSESYIVMSTEDFEYKNPVSHIGEIIFNSDLAVSISFLEKKGIKITDQVLETLKRRSLNSCKKEIKGIHNTPVPDELFQLFNGTSKKEQIKLLKGITIKTSSFMNFFFKAYKEHGFTLSQYKSYYHHKGADLSNLPLAAEKMEDGKIKVMGETNLTKGQIRNLIDQRKVKVSKFLDKDDEWHCFFLTYRGLKGEENHKGGQPHLHYISDKWGLSREKVLGELKNEKYSLPSLPHINYERHK